MCRFKPHYIILCISNYQNGFGCGPYETSSPALFLCPEIGTMKQFCLFSH
uniref:Uncharacterized protein n=1 Tax=Anguilla anguilla TaxID=7936 RepID=A0A0E9WGY7_ANGAN